MNQNLKKDVICLLDLFLKSIDARVNTLKPMLDQAKLGAKGNIEHRQLDFRMNNHKDLFMMILDFKNRIEKEK